MTFALPESLLLAFDVAEAGPPHVSSPHNCSLLAVCQLIWRSSYPEALHSHRAIALNLQPEPSSGRRRHHGGHIFDNPADWIFVQEALPACLPWSGDTVTRQGRGIVAVLTLKVVNTESGKYGVGKTDRQRNDVLEDRVALYRTIIALTHSRLEGT